jgi:hypothetical protein
LDRAIAAPVVIPSRFNGPLANGNGGYSAGLAANLLEGPVEATLRRPVPLEAPLEASVGDGEVRLLDGEDLILEAREVPGFAIEVPAAVGVAEARDAMTRYRGSDEGPFSRCFVCGIARDDSFGVCAGAVEGREVVASTWTPPEWTAGEDGRARPEFVWAAMDCPTFFAAYIGVEELPLSFLGRMTAGVDALPRVGEEHVVFSWPLGLDGRKAEAGVALARGGGEVLAAGRAMLIEAKGE